MAANRTAPPAAAVAATTTNMTTEMHDPEDAESCNDLDDFFGDTAQESVSQKPTDTTSWHLVSCSSVATLLGLHPGSLACCCSSCAYLCVLFCSQVVVHGCLLDLTGFMRRLCRHTLIKSYCSHYMFDCLVVTLTALHAWQSLDSQLSMHERINC